MEGGAGVRKGADNVRESSADVGEGGGGGDSRGGSLRSWSQGSGGKLRTAHAANRKGRKNSLSDVETAKGEKINSLM